MRRPPCLLEVLYSFESGGSERIGAVIAEGLVARGWSVAVAATHSASGPIGDALVSAGLPCHGLDIERHGRLARRWAIFRLCRRLRPDVLHVQHIPMFMLCYWPARLAGVRRFVVTEHTDWQLRNEIRVRRGFQRYARRASRITVIHEGLAGYIVDELGIPAARVRTIVNGVDSERFAPAERDATLRAQLGGDVGTSVLIGCVARLHPDKDHRTLLRAFAHMINADPGVPVRLVLIGDGEARPAIEALAKELGIEQHLLMLGDRADVAILMPQLDLLVLTSRTEGLPMVLLEAMACGLPCIATAVGGIPGLLREGGGELVEPGDYEMLAVALGRFAGDDVLRRQTGETARERVLTLYRETDMIDAYARELAAA